MTEPTQRAIAPQPVKLEVRGISKSFPGVKALDNISFRVRRGTTHVLCGENGCVDIYLSALRLAGECDGNLASFFEQLQRGVPEAVESWHAYRADLVRCVNNLRMAYDCLVILGGYVGEYLNPYLSELRMAAAALNTFEQDGSYLYVSTDKLENSAVGAGLTWITDYIQNI